MATRKTTTATRKPAAERKPPAAPKREPASIVPTGDMGELVAQGMRSAVTGENLSLNTLPPSPSGLYSVRVRKTEAGAFDHFEVEPYVEPKGEAS